MGIKMSILMVSDEQINIFQQNPSQLETLLNTTITSPSVENCFLSDYWDALHYVLTLKSDKDELPLSALKNGDVYYSDELSDPAHAIYSDTTRNFAEELNKLSKSEIMERCNLGRTLKVHVYRGRLNLVDEAEIVGCFLWLQNFTVKAVTENKGLVFCCYEDW